MHTLKVVGLGLALCGLCVVIGRAADSAGAGARVFIPVWLLGAGINMWIGVRRAGYSIADEAPVFLVVFLVPEAVAALVWWRTTRSS